jgi:hypothetical protein
VANGVGYGALADPSAGWTCDSAHADSTKQIPACRDATFTKVNFCGFLTKRQCKVDPMCTWSIDTIYDNRTVYHLNVDLSGGYLDKYSFCVPADANTTSPAAYSEWYNYAASDDLATFYGNCSFGKGYLAYKDYQKTCSGFSVFDDRISSLGYSGYEGFVNEGTNVVIDQATSDVTFENITG